MNTTTKIIAGVVGAAALGSGAVAVTDAQINPYTETASHYVLDIESDIKQGDRVEIHKDRPEMTLYKWNDELSITITPNMPTPSLGAARAVQAKANRPLLSKRMEFKEGDTTAFIEPKEDNPAEFDIDFTLESKPDTNVFTYTIEGAEELDFFYQPELTAEEIAEGAERPENVVGSYAVYHKTKANHRVGSTNYATGKVMHIYRPKAIDANGAEVWAELHYADGVLSVTVPQDFLENAMYPVVVDPTFGYTTVGGTATNLNGFIFGNGYSAPENGTVTSMTVYADLVSGTDAVIGLAMYTDSGGNPTDYITNDSVNVPNTTPGWVTSGAMSQAITSGTTYWLMSFPDASADTPRVYRDNTGTLKYVSATYPTYPDPISSPSTLGWTMSVYVTYTAAAAPATTPPPVIFFE